MKRIRRRRGLYPRRRREERTNYQQRLLLVKSGKPRVVVRRSLRNILCQLIAYHPTGDRIIVSSHSRELAKFGWKGANGNMVAAYFTGILLGKRAVENKINEAILDIGRQRHAAGNTIYAALKGAIDAGLNVPHSAEVFPSEDRLEGKHLKRAIGVDFESLKESIIGKEVLAKKGKPK